MSVLSVLFYIVHGKALRRGCGRSSANDATYLELFSSILVGQDRHPTKLVEALEQGIMAAWQDVPDFVNPFGDRRGDQFNSVWTFDLDKDLVLLTKNDRHCSASLELARERLLTQDDFELVSSTEPKPPQDESPPGPYWMPNLDLASRESVFLGRILRDFSYTWRHVIRREMNTSTFMKLTYAIIWMLRMEFTLLERTGFEHVSEGGPYVQVIDLPSWDTPKATLIPVGSSWFVLAQDTRDGFDIVRHHAKSSSSPGCSALNIGIYAILTLRQIILCKAVGVELAWTKPEKLFDGSSPSDTGVDLIIWAATTSRTKHPPTVINLLPAEIQDKILRYATASLVASAKLGCELGLGSPFSWMDRGVAIHIAESKRHRVESSPVESHIVFNGVKSGLSYKRQYRY